jgi:hypothetical protein
MKTPSQRRTNRGLSPYRRGSGTFDVEAGIAAGGLSAGVACRLRCYAELGPLLRTAEVLVASAARLTRIAIGRWLAYRLPTTSSRHTDACLGVLGDQA